MRAAVTCPGAWLAPLRHWGVGLDDVFGCANVFSFYFCRKHEAQLRSVRAALLKNRAERPFVLAVPNKRARLLDERGSDPTAALRAPSSEIFVQTVWPGAVTTRFQLFSPALILQSVRVHWLLLAENNPGQLGLAEGRQLFI